MRLCDRERFQLVEHPSCAAGARQNDGHGVGRVAQARIVYVDFDNIVLGSGDEHDEARRSVHACIAYGGVYKSWLADKRLRVHRAPCQYVASTSSSGSHISCA